MSAQLSKSGFGNSRDGSCDAKRMERLAVFVWQPDWMPVLSSTSLARHTQRSRIIEQAAFKAERFVRLLTALSDGGCSHALN